MKEAFEKIKERLKNELHLAKEDGERYLKGNSNQFLYARARGYEVAMENASEIVNQVAEEYKNDFCEWFKYDYRTIAPKNHDVENPYWRIPEDYGKLMFCPYCGKKIEVVE